MQITARFVRPVLPSTTAQTELMRVDYDAWVEGDIPTTDNLLATLETGSGSCTFDDGWSVTGAGNLKVAGSAIHWFEFGNDIDGNPRTAHDYHYWSRYVRIGGAGTSTAWFAGVTNGTASAWACQIGLTSGSKLEIRDADTGTGTGAATGTVTYSTGQIVRMELKVGNGVQTWAIFGNDTASTDTDDALEVITCNCTATTFLRNRVGLFNTLSTGAATGDLWHVNFDGSSGSVTASSAGASTMTGSGSLTYQSVSSVEYLHVNGTGAHVLRKNFTAVASLYTVLELGLTTAPGTNDVVTFQAYDSSSVVSWQVLITTGGKIKIRNNNNGTGANTATSTNSLPSAAAARQLHITASGSTLTCILKNGGTTVETISCTIDDDSYTGVAVGLIGGAPTTAIDLRYSYLDVDSTALPTGSGATNLDIRFDRDWSSSDAMPAPLPVKGPTGDFTVSSNLVPSYGCWLGSSTPFGSQAGSTLAGLRDFQDVTGSDPDICKFYKRGAWTGKPSTAEASQITADKRRRLVMYGWKIAASNESYSLTEIANGDLDDRIRTAAQGAKEYGHLFWLTLYHEYDNNFSERTGNTHPSTAEKTAYRNMFKHVHTVFREEGCKNARFVWNVTGFSTWQVDYPDLYPGDDYVDWVAIDPYAHTTDSDFAAGVDGNGGYTWMAVTRVGLGHAKKPIMLAEYGIDRRTAADPDVPGSGATGMTDAKRKAHIETMAEQAKDQFPELKAIIYWNFFTKNGDYRFSSSNTASAAYGTMASNSYFNLDTTKAS